MLIHPKTATGILQENEAGVRQQQNGKNGSLLSFPSHSHQKEHRQEHTTLDEKNACCTFGALDFYAEPALRAIDASSTPHLGSIVAGQENGVRGEMSVIHPVVIEGLHPQSNVLGDPEAYPCGNLKTSTHLDGPEGKRQKKRWLQLGSRPGHRGASFASWCTPFEDTGSSQIPRRNIPESQHPHAHKINAHSVGFRSSPQRETLKLARVVEQPAEDTSFDELGHQDHLSRRHRCTVHLFWGRGWRVVVSARRFERPIFNQQHFFLCGELKSSIPGVVASIKTQSE